MRSTGNSRFDQVEKLYGRVDIMVSNAAPRPETPLAQITFEEWRLVLSTILDGAFMCAQRAAALVLNTTAFAATWA